MDEGLELEGLREKVRLLSAENEMLAERAEDSLLLGLIGEKIALCDDPDRLADTALEQCVVLKDLAVALCLDLDGDEAAVRASYVMYSTADLRGTSFPCGRELRAAMASGGVVDAEVGGPEGFVPALSRAVGSELHSFVCVAYRGAPGRETAFAFADERGNPRLGGINSMLRRVVDMVRAKDENLRLMRELTDLNSGLDRLVAARTEQLERANRALSVEVEERARAEAGLRRALGEKTVLLRELHHRVKNNLQVISSLLSLQAAECDEESLRIGFEASQERVRAMAMVHEGLCKSESVEAIDVGDFLVELCADIARAHRLDSARLRVEAAHAELSLDQAVPCALLVNELVALAGKRAIPNRGPGGIVVSLRRAEGGSLELSVSDDGAGTSPGQEDPASIGMSLASSLARQLGGELVFERLPGGGARLFLRFAPALRPNRGGD